MNPCRYEILKAGKRVATFYSAREAFLYHKTHAGTGVYRRYADGTLDRWL
jgi:hypothetical protein